MQAERQLMTARNPRLKPTPQRAPSPIRVPQKRQPNQTEARYNADKLDGNGIYEAITVRVPSGKYTPDWLYFAPDGTIHLIEVKGAFKYGSQSGASAKFKEAVERYPGFVWTWAKWADGVWQEWTSPVPRAPESPTDNPTHTRARGRR